jgi:hypothetical protein
MLVLRDPLKTFSTCVAWWGPEAGSPNWPLRPPTPTAIQRCVYRPLFPFGSPIHDSRATGGGLGGEGRGTGFCPGRAVGGWSQSGIFSPMRKKEGQWCASRCVPHPGSTKRQCMKCKELSGSDGSARGLVTGQLSNCAVLPPPPQMEISDQWRFLGRRSFLT